MQLCKLIITTACILIMIPAYVVGQQGVLMEVTEKYEHTESSHPVYIDENDEPYTRHIIIRFNQRPTHDDKPIEHRHYNDVFITEDERIAEVLNEFKGLSGIQRIEKLYPDARYGDTQSRSVRTGEPVEVSDDSKVFVVEVSELLPVKDIPKVFNAFPAVEFAHGPEVIHTLSEVVDDPLAECEDPENEDCQWALEPMEMDKAWSISGENDNIRIAVSDFFSFNDDLYDRHVDLELEQNSGNIIETDPSNKAVLDTTHRNFHGPEVSSIVGATTDT